MRCISFFKYFIRCLYDFYMFFHPEMMFFHPENIPPAVPPVGDYENPGVLGGFLEILYDFIRLLYVFSPINDVFFTKYYLIRAASGRRQKHRFEKNYSQNHASKHHLASLFLDLGLF